MPPRIIEGPPGEAWTNDTDKILFQLHVQFHNSCGSCIALANQIGPWWPVPFHRGCSCVNVPVPPGTDAHPYVDFTEEIAKLDPVRQSRVIGKANLQLVESGVVGWDDVVSRTRIRPLKEVVARYGLDVDQLTSAGVSRYQAVKAYTEAHTPERVAAAKSQADLIAKLKTGGLTAAEIRRAVASRLAERVGIGGGPSGPVALKVVSPPESPKPTPKPTPTPTPTPEPTPVETGALQALKRAEAEAKAAYDRLKGKGYTPDLQAARSAWLEAGKRIADFEAGVVPQTPTRPAPKSTPQSDQALRDAVTGARKLSDQIRDIQAWVATNRENAPQPVQKHRMPAPETMDRVSFSGITWHFQDTPESRKALAFALRSMAETPPLPARLLNATKDVYFSSSIVEHPYLPGMNVPATGGQDQAVVSYGNNYLDIGLFSHESGHNLATELYGSIFPSARSEFKAATAIGEKPPSDYGAINASEDFAESVRYYVTDPAKFRSAHPERAKVIGKILREPTYGG